MQIYYIGIPYLQLTICYSLALCPRTEQNGEMSRKQFRDKDNGGFYFSTMELFYSFKPSNIIEIYLDNTIIIIMASGELHTEEVKSGGHESRSALA